MIGLSTARADITPLAGAVTEMGGYATLTEPRRATGTYSPLMARVMVLSDGGAVRVLVTLDAGTIPPPWYAMLLPRLTALGVPAADIAVGCTHTHNAPMTLSHPHPGITYAATDLGPAAAYWAALADTVVNLVDDALHAPRRVVTLDYRSITQNWSAPRTQPPTYTETAVPVFVARDLTGRPVALWFGFGTHAVTAGMQTLWDGDYPAAACAAIEAVVPGCHAQFVAGSGGDQDPVGNRSWGARDARGAQLGSAVVTALMTVGRPLTGFGPSTLTSVAVPLQVPTTPAERAARRAELDLRRGANAGLYNLPTSAYYKRHATYAIDLIDAGTDPHVVDVPIQVWRFAGSPTLRVLLMGGEPVSGFGLWARTRYGGTTGIAVGGYVGGVPCYIVGDTFFSPTDTNGSYEGGWNTLDPLCAGESACCYGMCWHFMPGLTSGCAEPTILAALTAALA